MNTEGSTSELNDVYSTIKLIDENNPMLHTKASEFDFSNPKYNPVRLYESVGSFMLKKNGLGLSANQVGFDARMFTLRATEVTPFFNPVIVWRSEETTIAQEGCLSYPFLFLKIKRAANIRVRFADPTGKVQTQAFSGITARCIQHECDHLDGVTFVDHAKPFALKLARERAIKLARKTIRMPQIAYSM